MNGNVGDDIEMQAVDDDYGTPMAVSRVPYDTSYNM